MSQDGETEASLVKACKEGLLAKVKELLDGGADPNQQDDYGETGLHECARHDHSEIARVMLDRNCDPHIRAHKNNGWQALHIAAQYKMLETARVVVEFGAPINGLAATQIKDPAHVHELLLVPSVYSGAYGCDHCGEDGRGQVYHCAQCNWDSHGRCVQGEADTALVIACRQNCADMVKFLLSKGADPNIKGKNGKNAFGEAAGNEEIETLLRGAGAANNQQNKQVLGDIVDASKQNDLDKVKQLIEGGVKVNSQDSFGETGLHECGRHNHSKLARYLLEQKGDLTIKANKNNGWTPLHVAAEYDAADTIKVMLEFNPPINELATVIGATKGDTPVIQAARKNNREAARLLIKAGADPTIKGKNGRDAFEESGSSEMKGILEGKESAGPDKAGGQTAMVDIRHRQHALAFSPDVYGSGEFRCDVCGSFGTGGAYHCEHCNWDVHARCLRTESYKHPKHAHVLSYMEKVYNGEYGCDVCGNSGSGEVYHCSDCSWDCHISCVSWNVDMDIVEQSAKGNYENVKAILAAGGKVDKADEYGETGLHEAARNGHPTIAELLLQHGADPTNRASKNNGWQPLHIASNYNKVKVAQVFLDDPRTQVNGRAITADTEEGKADTPLHLAVRNQRKEVAKLLIERNADPTLIGKKGKSCLEEAANDRELKELLEQGTEAKTEAGAKVTGDLVAAAKSGNIAEVKRLVDGGVKVNSQDSYGETGLHECGRHNHSKVAEFLLEHKGDLAIKARKNNGWTALHVGCEYNAVETIRIMLQPKYNPPINSLACEVEGHPGDTPVVMAAKKRWAEVVSLLIAAKADPNLKGKANKSAFEICEGDPLITKLLQGMSLEKARSAVATPVEVLPMTPPEVKSESKDGIVEACAKGNLDRVKALLEASDEDRAEPNTQDSYGETGLHEAARHGHLSIAIMLLEKKADPRIEATGNNGWQPLHIAAYYGHTRVAQAILESAGKLEKEPPNPLVNLLAKDRGETQGDSPIFMAVKGKREEVARLLMNAGADPNIKGKNGNSALQEAGDNAVLVDILLQQEQKQETKLIVAQHGHPLFLLSAPPDGTSYVCKFCGCESKGEVYHCRESGCDYDLHRLCAEERVSSEERGLFQSIDRQKLDTCREPDEFITEFDRQLKGLPPDTKPHPLSIDEAFKQLFKLKGMSVVFSPLSPDRGVLKPEEMRLKKQEQIKMLVFFIKHFESKPELRKKMIRDLAFCLTFPEVAAREVTNRRNSIALAHKRPSVILPSLLSSEKEVRWHPNGIGRVYHWQQRIKWRLEDVLIKHKIFQVKTAAKLHTLNPFLWSMRVKEPRRREVKHAQDDNDDDMGDASEHSEDPYSLLDGTTCRGSKTFILVSADTFDLHSFYCELDGVYHPKRMQATVTVYKLKRDAVLRLKEEQERNKNATLDKEFIKAKPLGRFVANFEHTYRTSSQNLVYTSLLSLPEDPEKDPTKKVHGWGPFKVANLLVVEMKPTDINNNRSYIISRMGFGGCLHKRDGPEQPWMKRIGSEEPTEPRTMPQLSQDLARMPWDASDIYSDFQQTSGGGGKAVKGAAGTGKDDNVLKEVASQIVLEYKKVDPDNALDGFYLVGLEVSLPPKDMQAVSSAQIAVVDSLEDGAMGDQFRDFFLEPRQAASQYFHFADPFRGRYIKITGQVKSSSSKANQQLRDLELSNIQLKLFGYPANSARLTVHASNKFTNDFLKRQTSQASNTDGMPALVQSALHSYVPRYIGAAVSSREKQSLILVQNFMRANLGDVPRFSMVTDAPLELDQAGSQVNLLAEAKSSDSPPGPTPSKTNSKEMQCVVELRNKSRALLNEKDSLVAPNLIVARTTSQGTEIVRRIPGGLGRLRKGPFTPTWRHDGQGKVSLRMEKTGHIRHVLTNVQPSGIATGSDVVFSLDVQVSSLSSWYFEVILKEYPPSSNGRTIKVGYAQSNWQLDQEMRTLLGRFIPNKRTHSGVIGVHLQQNKVEFHSSGPMFDRTQYADGKKQRLQFDKENSYSPMVSPLIMLPPGVSVEVDFLHFSNNVNKLPKSLQCHTIEIETDNNEFFTDSLNLTALKPENDCETLIFLDRNVGSQVDGDELYFDVGDGAHSLVRLPWEGGGTAMKRLKSDHHVQRNVPAIFGNVRNPIKPWKLDQLDTDTKRDRIEEIVLQLYNMLDEERFGLTPETARVGLRMLGVEEPAVGETGSGERVDLREFLDRFWKYVTPETQENIKKKVMVWAQMRHYQDLKQALDSEDALTKTRRYLSSLLYSMILYLFWPFILVFYLVLVVPFKVLAGRQRRSTGILQDGSLVLITILFGPIYYAGIVSVVVYYTMPFAIRDSDKISFMEAWLPAFYTFIAGFHIFLNRAVPDSVNYAIFEDEQDYVDRELEKLNTSTLTATREEAWLDVYTTVPSATQRQGSHAVTAASVLDAVRSFNDNELSTSSRGIRAFLRYAVPVLVSGLHCVLPTIYRVVRGFGLLTELEIEEGRRQALFLYSIHIIIAFPVLTFIFHELTNFALSLIDSISDLRRLAVITSPKLAMRTGFSFFLCLEEKKNAVNWMTVRAALRKSTSKAWEGPFKLLRPLLILFIGLVVLIFVRALVYRDTISIATLLALYDSVTLCIYLLVILFMLVKVNDVLLDEHLYCVKNRQYEVAAKVVDLQQGQASNQHEAQLRSYQLQFLQNLQHRLEDPFYQAQFGVTLFGNLVRLRSIQRLAVLAFSGISASLVDVITQYVDKVSGIEQ